MAANTASMLFPADVVAVERRAYDVIGAFPAELDAVSGAVQRRKNEYLTARTCAREALRGLGFPAAPILTGPRGVPMWPPGVAGSMTHCAGYIAAAVCASGAYAGIGLDAEPNAPLAPGVLESVSCHVERTWVRDLAESARGVCADAILFSAKESTYKALYPLIEQEFDFLDVVVTVHGNAWKAAVRLPGADPAIGGSLRVEGRWIATARHIVTGVLVGPTRSPARAAPPRSTRGAVVAESRTWCD